MSSFTTLINLFLALPLGVLPASSIVSLPLSIHSLPPLHISHHLSLASLTLSAEHLTCAVSLMQPFLILCIGITPIENLIYIYTSESQQGGAKRCSLVQSWPPPWTSTWSTPHHRLTALTEMTVQLPLPLLHYQPCSQSCIRSTLPRH